MNNFIKSFIIPLIVLGTIALGAYNLVMYNLERIKKDPINQKYITMYEREMQLNCLADNIYYESAGEDAESKVSVAQVTLNRVKTGKFGEGVCGVVYKPSQFSWTIAKPRALKARNVNAYNESKIVAKKVLMEGFRLPSIEKSLYYHTKAVNPSWNKNLKVDAVIGQHIIYSIKPKGE
jgi:spore germination cell wall hydrolase CwlJ-like protein